MVEAKLQKLSEEKFRALLVSSRFPNIVGDMTLEKAKIVFDNEIYIEDGKIVYMRDNLPSKYSIDPVSGVRRTYCTKRSTRPMNPDECAICKGDTTTIILSERLNNGNYAFVNENRYPIISPHPMENIETGERDLWGYHFLIWPSTEHKAIHNMSAEEHLASLNIMKKLEGMCRQGENLQVIKNQGRACGNSLAHDHYQALISNHPAIRIKQEEEFLRREGKSLVQHLSGAKGTEKLADFHTVEIFAPYYSRRALEAIVAPKNTQHSTFSQLTEKELYDFSSAIVETTKKLSEVMPEKFKRELAYNMVFHTGPIGTMYVEILPYVQAEGGFEKAGFDVSQADAPKTKEAYGEFSTSKREEGKGQESCEICSGKNTEAKNIRDVAFSSHYIDDIADISCSDCGHSWTGNWGYRGLA